ncbi:hypothetical protein QEH56_19640 [Pelagicoccus enzymogenes]|uniref:autotransporter outer membrane beta-barrel domain-containing protein n=1 Tax=Pelagicoccus enzymogenes TaxID=2773457 RepID=UPI00280D2DE1|nr:hypothetical protein [Pelagicoccus enzymogenes]MDQ8200387.1 hypothetical protein [Pelagicoccus enzymogenes]
MKRRTTLLSAFLASFLLPQLQAQVNVQILLTEDAAVSGAGPAEISGYSYPKANRNGTFYTKAGFFDDSGDLPVAGSVLVQLTGPNTAQVLLRDDLQGLEPLTYEPFYPTDAGDIIFQGKYSAEDPQVGSVFKLSGGTLARLKESAGLETAAFNGTSIIHNVEGISYANLAKITPEGNEQSFPLYRGAVPGLEGVTFRSFSNIAHTPSGQIFFTARFEGESIDFLNDHALFTEDGAGNLQMIVRDSGSYPDTPRLPSGGTFRDLSGNIHLGCNDIGQLAFRAVVDAPDSRGSGSANSIWFQHPDQVPELIAVDFAPLETANAGELNLGALTAGSGTHSMTPLLDAAGNVYFAAEVRWNVQEPPYGDIGFFKWDGTDTHLIGYFHSMLPLPEDIAVPSLELQELSLSASGRIALYVVIKDDRKSVAASIYAQDDEGAFTEVITRSLGQYAFQRANFVADGHDYGPAGTLYLPPLDAGFSGSEDGNGQNWWTADDRLLFSIGYIDNNESKSAYCLATIGEPQVPPSGNKYTFDNDLETSSWQSVASGRSNWYDSIGARWDLPPNRADAAATIPAGEFVALETGNVQVGSLDSRGQLDLYAPLAVRGNATLATVNVEAGGSLTVEGNATLTGNITATGAHALIADAPSGDISIHATENSPHLSSSTQSTLLASAPGNIDFNIDGEMTSSVGPAQGTTANIYATSEFGSVSFTTKGAYDAIGHKGSKLNFYAAAPNGIAANLEGAYASSGPNLLFEASGGDIVVDTAQATLTGETGAIIADNTGGSIAITSGEISASGSDAVHATASGEITISAQDSITLIDGDFAIYAKSSGSNVDINSRAEISTTGQTHPGVGIEGNAQGDVTIKQSAPINSDFGAVIGFSTAGTVDIDTSTTYLAGEQGGIRATAEGGSILIKSGEIAAGNQQGIYAVARDSVSIVSTGEITGIGNNSTGIFASSEQAGVSIIQNGDVSATGTNATGIVADSATTITVQITSGSISGWTGPNAGVILSQAQNATLTNHGDISSASEIGIIANSINTTIENHGRIHGKIQLGTGTNQLKNETSGFLYSVGEYIIGSKNTLNNSGSLILSELAENIGTTTLDGQFQQSSSGSVTAQIGTEGSADQLTISGNANLSGSLVAQVTEPLTSERLNTILQASAITGTFSRVLPVQASQGLPIEELAKHARQYPSRTLDASLAYSENNAILSLKPLILDTYQRWAEHFLGPAAAPPSDSFQQLSADPGLTADPDQDGLSNLAEYVFGTHPLFPSESPFSSQLTNHLPEAPTHTISFPIAKELTDASWILESSQNLQHWEPLSIENATTKDLGDLTRYELTLQPPPSPTFYRISVSTPNGQATSSLPF